MPPASSLDPIPMQRVVLQLHDKCRIIVDDYGNGPSFKRTYCVSTSAACTDILLPIMFNDTFIILICKVFSCMKCGCFCKVDFSGFILFDMTLKVDEGRKGETVSILHFF